MTDQDFEFLRILLHGSSGLSLGSDKRYLVESRLGMLCSRRGIDGIPALVRTLRTQAGGALKTAVVEAMTTNETLFFRDRKPFDTVRDTLLPEKLAANAGRRSLRIWCAAVSSGQEAYSLAMMLDDMASRFAGWTIDIVATDLSAEILAKAREGLYSQFEIQRGLPIQRLLQYFRQEGDNWRIIERLREMITFRQHNLLDGSAHLGQFDIIFCRNVLIYFDLPTKARVMDGLAQRLAPDGALILGAAETVLGITSRLVPDALQRSVYRQASPPASQRPAAVVPQQWGMRLADGTQPATP